ncbi:flagellar biosynthetic protein FliR [Ahrensia sp. R2A130]|uniref:flagellar biosynthetic protein FliR n=1 Tax=Ahrensia sp. R2A130 TaxID=744979 RepID=UPI0005917306|nr:flagellar biosynthetic protein FliR [Ahrensia sp. R2A130]
MIATGEFAILIATFCRVGGCFIVLPGLSSGRIPGPARIYLTLAVALSIAFARGGEGQAVIYGSGLLRLIFAESLVGLFIGLAARMMMLALSFAGTSIGMVIGFNNLFGQGVEDSESQAALTTLITFSALVLLFQMDFHHAVIASLHRSYEIFPQGAVPEPQMLLVNITRILSSAFFIVLGLAGPFLVYGLIFNTAIGVLNKLTPQIPIFFVSLPVLIMGGLMLAYLALPELLRRFVDAFFQLPILP